MTGEEFLRGIRADLPAKRSIDAEIREYRLRLFNIAAPPPDAEKVSGGQPSGIDRRLESLEAYQERIIGQKKELEARMNRAYNLLQELSDARHYRVLWDYYLRGLSEDDIAAVMFPVRDGEKPRRAVVNKLKREALVEFDKVYTD